MPANTPKGLPYPLPSEPVAEGAQAIRNLAEAVDARLRLTVIDDYAAASALATYDTNARLGTNNIPQTYRDLLLRVTGFLDSGTETTGVVQLNGLSTGHYSQELVAVGATVNGAEGINTGFSVAFYMGVLAFTCELEFPNYATPVGGNNLLAWNCRYHSQKSLAASGGRIGQTGGVVVFNPTGLKRIILDSTGTPNFAAGTRFTLYGRG